MRPGRLLDAGSRPAVARSRPTVRPRRLGARPIEVGDYWAALRISDGGLGPALLEAVEERARTEGWDERYRCDLRDGVQLGYVRDEFKVDVNVGTRDETVRGRIRIQRVGDGNPWPPDC